VLKRASGPLLNWLNAAVNKKEYIERLQMVVQQLHNCTATYRETVPVHETFHGKTLWHGDVEVFDLQGHPKATRCYGWTHSEPEEFMTILELPPVNTAQSAVKVGVVYQIKKGTA
jgi:hypothetical protein